MQQLNYHHLYYFYVTAKEGSIAKASRQLQLTPQTISSQIGELEKYFDLQLFTRKGKRLVLNEPGHKVFTYAKDIFGLGEELMTTLKYQTHTQTFPFYVGIADVIPKILAFDLFRCCLEQDFGMKFVAKEGNPDDLLVQLASGKLDIVLTDRPIAPGKHIKAYNHLIGESGISFFAQKSDCKQLQTDFPMSLDAVPMLFPGENSTLKMSLFTWFEDMQIMPDIVGEFEDSALKKLFGQAGFGCFCAPQSAEKHILEQYDVGLVGRTDEIKEQYYLISPERKIKHPAVLPLLDEASKLFSAS